MKPKFRNVFVFYGKGVRTGGNLAAVQLVDQINRLGGRAFLVPSESSRNSPPVPEFSGFDAPECAEIDDSVGNAVIGTEYRFRKLEQVSRAQRIIWWLSIDKSPAFRWRSPLLARNFPRFFGELWSAFNSGEFVSFIKMSFLSSNRVIHLAQSVYAMTKLKQIFGLNSYLLGDYIWPEPEATGVVNSHGPVAYNPKKGSGPKVEKLKRSMPDIDWLPLEQLSHPEVREALMRASVYIDFCNFPGKDRLPREALLSGTPVLLASRGSAAVEEDFPIPVRFKIQLDDRWLRNAQNSLRDVVADPDRALEEQSQFVTKIRSEKREFSEQVQNHFFL